MAEHPGPDAAGIGGKLGSREIVIRLIIWSIIVIEALIATGVIPFPGGTLTLAWLVYVVAGYLLLYELPMALAGDDGVARGYWRVVGAFVINALVFDLIGQLYDLWEVPIVGPITYDNLVHATSMPFAICAIAWAFAMTLQRRYRLQHLPGFVPAFVIMGALSLSAVHELIELAIDLATGSNAGTGIAPGDLYDTHLDLFYDAVGIGLFVIGLAVARSVFADRRERSGEIAA